MARYDLGLVKGSKGDIGPQGEVGPQGPTGPVGPPIAVNQVSVTITAAGWLGTGPYTQVVTVSDLMESQNGDIGLSNTATDEQFDAVVDAKLRIIGQAAGSITLKATGVRPMVDIPCAVTLLG